MSIKVSIPMGQDMVSVTGLHQWDYGQVLEIESPDIGSEIVEVHFACVNMTEAVVRSCSFSNGVGTVTIPDQCLEQTTTVTAWIYRVVGTEGHTIKTITLPIMARTRPSKVREIPHEFSDKYTELITEINEAVDNLENGNITVAHATLADRATEATTAGNAQSANYATSALRAEVAIEDGKYRNIAETYGNFNEPCIYRLADDTISALEEKGWYYIAAIEKREAVSSDAARTKIGGLVYYGDKILPISLMALKTDDDVYFGVVKLSIDLQGVISITGYFGGDGSTVQNLGEDFAIYTVYMGRGEAVEVAI